MSSYYGIILVVLMFVSGIVWLIDSLTAGKKRKQAIKDLYDKMLKPPQEAIDAVAKEPIHVDYAKSFFPILFIIVVLRSFLYEPFQIPSASMKPTLKEGDFILVNKFNYGLRLPINSQKVVDIGLPKRGDVAVFRAPDTGEDYIKRVIGIPGDRIIYTTQKELYIKPACPDGVAQSECPKEVHVKKELVAGPGYIDRNPDSGVGVVNREFVETIDGATHGILNNPNVPHYTKNGQRKNSVFIVPQGKYFVMGDNRDNSKDSRFWDTTHYVPEENLVGQAVSIWMHFEFGIKNRFFSWVPTGVDLDRVGAIE
jgi:signal peptidase I